MSEHELTFACMGTVVRLIGPDAAALELAREWLDAFDRRLSRFRADSELCALNDDPSQAAPASALLRTAVGAALHAARRTGGLVDPTVLPALRSAGYRASLAGVAPADLRAALAAAPDRRPARPHPARAWASVRVDHRARAVVRPAGVQLDSGGTGKGLGADLVARRLGPVGRTAVDCGGDICVGGARVARSPFEVEVAHPFTAETCRRLWLRSGAIATSGIDSRLWRRPDGSFAHHLIDPASGEPAWTGLVSVTALAPTTLEAETLAKQALLSGPARARDLLTGRGGLLVHDDGDVEPVGPLARDRVTAA